MLTSANTRSGVDHTIVVVGDWSAVKDQVVPFGDVTVYDESGKVKKPTS